MSANAETMLVKNQLEDGLEDDKQTQKNVLSPETQCITNILRNCISNAEIAAVLPIVLQLNTVSSVESKELSTTLQRHQMLEDRLNMLGDLKPVSDGEQERRKSTRIQLEEKIKDSFRNILRHLRACSDTVSNWKEELGMEVGTSEKALIQELKKFHSHVLEKLHTSYDKEPQLTSTNQVSLSSDHDVEPIVSLQDFPAVIKEVNAKISQKNQQIQSLQSFLQEKKKEASALAKQHQSIIEASQETQNRVQQEIDQLTAQLNSLIVGNRQAERALQEKNENVETDIELLLQDFDDEIEEIQADVELNEMEYEREKEELKELETQMLALEVEYTCIQERRRLAEEKRREEVRELELKTKAAILAQAWWRGYSTRKALKKKGKSKKAKKGKGKQTK